MNLMNISKSYDDLMVLDHVSFTLEPKGTYCLMGASGSGKTTLLRILLGLEKADSGSIQMPPNYRLVSVFQENRLCESFSALENIRMVTDSTYTKDQIYQELCTLLPEESIMRPVHTLSGGMKRRVAILRALLAPSDGIVMDEPFTGLDEDTKQQVVNYILAKTKDKLLLVTTHQEEDIALLDATLLTLYTKAP